MSRCFPFPPPGYALSGQSSGALIESIKFQKESVKSKEQRKKEKRREKKEKRKDKKDKTNQNTDKSHLFQTNFGEKVWAVTRGEFLPKGSKAEPEQLERSSLTEEHGKPVCLRAPSTSSDSTENSNKRKRHSSPVDVTRGHGKIIRIRLPLKKQKQSAVLANEQQPCSTSGRVLVPPQNEGVINNRTNREQICLTSQPIETCVAKRTTPKPPLTNAVLTPMQRLDLQYKNLLDSLAPPQHHDSSLDEDDLDWLVKGKNQELRTEKKQIPGNASLSCSSSLGLWPRAQFLQEVDLYALPFTVPY